MNIGPPLNTQKESAPMPKKKSPAVAPEAQTAAHDSIPTPAKRGSRGKDSTALVVTLRTALKDALAISAKSNFRSLSGQATQYILEGLKRDGVLLPPAALTPPNTKTSPPETSPQTSAPKPLNS